MGAMELQRGSTYSAAKVTGLPEYGTHPDVITSTASSLNALTLDVVHTQSHVPSVMAAPCEALPHNRVKAISDRAAKVVHGLGDFTLLKVLGRGCFGKVFMAERKGDSQVLAIKAMSKAHLGEQEVLTWVAQEQKVLEKLSEHSNPSIVKLHHAFSTPTHIIFVMDFLNGGDLGFHLKQCKTGCFAAPRARFYFAEIALALDFLHSQCRIIYRDLKPENVLLNSAGHTVLTDFGFADFATTKSNKFTAFCGSPDYISPEMIHSDERAYSFDVDWWSAAVMLYEFLTGQCPWSHDDVPEQYDMICDDPLPRQNLSDDAWELLNNMLDKDLKKRAKTLAQVKTFAFLADVNWETVNESTPPFVPTASERDTRYFANKFIEMTPEFSVVKKKAMKAPKAKPKGAKNKEKR